MLAFCWGEMLKAIDTLEGNITQWLVSKNFKNNQNVISHLRSRCSITGDREDCHTEKSLFPPLDKIVFSRILPEENSILRQRRVLQSDYQLFRQDYNARKKLFKIYHHFERFSWFLLCNGRQFVRAQEHLLFNSCSLYCWVFIWISSIFTKNIWRVSE